MKRPKYRNNNSAITIVIQKQRTKIQSIQTLALTGSGTGCSGSFNFSYSILHSGVLKVISTNAFPKIVVDKSPMNLKSSSNTVGLNVQWKCQYSY
jgi:hypothetical protein